MKRYEYVALKTKLGFASISLESHRELIDQYAKAGYRYVGFIPTETFSDGAFKAVDLIFEIDC